MSLSPNERALIGSVLGLSLTGIPAKPIPPPALKALPFPPRRWTRLGDVLTEETGAHGRPVVIRLVVWIRHGSTSWLFGPDGALHGYEVAVDGACGVAHGRPVVGDRATELVGMLGYAVPVPPIWVEASR